MCRILALKPFQAVKDLVWVLRDPAVTSALIGASRVEQVDQNVATVSKLGFSEEELARIEGVLAA